VASAPPCPACETSTTVIKNGHRYTKRGVSQRWMCKACVNSWTQNSTTHRMTEMGGRDRTPEINQRIWELAMSGVTMRRIATLVGCTRRTVSRKLHYLSVRAWAYHAEHGPKTGWAMMDELETFMGARWRQITVAVVIRAKTREILSVSVGPVSSTMAKSKAAGWTKDTRVDTSRDAFGNAAPFIKLPALTLRYPYHHKGR
jgi:transposase-like protein